MEFNLINKRRIEFVGGLSEKMDEAKKRKVAEILKLYWSRYPVILNPVLDEMRSTDDLLEATVDTKSFRKNSIELLFGDTFLALNINNLYRNAGGFLTTYLTFASSNTAKLMIETKGTFSNDVNILEELLVFEKNLPANSLEFSLKVKGFEYDDETKFDIFGKGLKLKRNEKGTASLEMTNIDLPSGKWWELWRYSEATTFSGDLSVNVKLDIAAVIQLYKKHFCRGPLATEVDTPTDLVIMVGGNEDKEKAIKCHKSILCEMSPVFAAMFQVDMLEAKEGTLKIVDFSEACIRALIEFAYRRNLEEVLRSSEVTLELLQVADKYGIKKLMEILLQIVWSMPCYWFSADMAVKFFVFGKNAGEDFAEAEEKGWAALKWYATKYPEQLMGSKEFASLCENPRDAMEFVMQLLKKSK